MTEKNTPSTDPIAEKPPEPTTRQKLWLVGRAAINRIRFIAVLGGVLLFIGYWDHVKSHWDRWTHPRAAANRELPPGEEFFCSMDPQVVRTTYEPNGNVPDCPICGMPLTIRAKGQKEELPAGITGRVRLSPDRVQLAGIKTVAVEYRPVFKQIKTVGYVTFDESRLSRVVSRVGGYVQKLYVDKTFSMVQKGDPLVEIDSPEFYSAAKELIQAERYGVSREVADRQKLLVLGFSEEEVRAIAAAKEPPTRLVIRAPMSGHVIDKRIELGASVEPKMTLFEVADLSAVWIEAEVYENDIPFLRAGQEIEATVEAYPNRRFTGKVALVHPHLETATRTNSVRFTLENPGHVLRPGMYAAVTINTPLETIEPYKTLAAKSARVIMVSQKDGAALPQEQFLVVPEQAVVDTGARKIVYVQRQEGLFEGVEVELGPRQDDVYPVLKGLSAGDRVVAAGGFLVDAETRLNPAAASTYFGASGGPQSGSGPPPVTQKPSQDKSAEARRPAAAVPAKAEVGITAERDEYVKNIEQLPPEDWQPAKAQGICPLTKIVLGSMGVPVKITLRGKPVYLCCKNCIGKARRDPDGTLAKLEK